MKKIAIIGASGMAGRAIYKLAIQNPRLEVTGIVRHEDKARQVLGARAHLLIADILKIDAAKLKDFDTIIDAFGTSPDKAADQITLAKKLISMARQSKARVILILGAGSLHTGKDHHLFVQDIARVPGSKDWINTPKQQLKELQYLETVKDVDWLGISPSAKFEAGPATEFIVGKDDLLKNKAGASKTTSGTMASLIVSETVEPLRHKRRITVCDK